MGKKYSIIILEKEMPDAELLELQLKKAGLQFSAVRISSRDVFTSSAAGLSPDLIIGNLNLPRFDIMAALDEAKTTLPGVPWIVVAMTASEEQAVSCMRLGAADFVLKKNIARLGPAAKTVLEKPRQAAPVAEEPPAKKPVAEPEETVPFREIVEHAPDLIAVIGPDGRRQYNNPYYGAVLDDPDILLGTDSFVDIHPEDRERIKRIFREIVTTGHGQETEYRLMDSEGNTRVIDSRSAVTRDAAGNPNRVIVFSRDITAKARARRLYDTLVASTAGVSGEPFFSILVQHLSEALNVSTVVVSGGLDAGRTRVSSLGFWAEGILQPSVEYAVSGTPCEDVLTRGTTVIITSGLRKQFAEIPRVGMPDAESYVGTPLPGLDGTPIGHLFVMDEKPLEDPQRVEFVLRVFAHRAALELLRMRMPVEPRQSSPAPRPQPAPAGDETLWLERLMAATIVRDPNGRVAFWNGAAERMYERSSAEAVGRTLAEACGASQEEIDECVRTALERGEWSGDSRHTTASGRELDVESRWSLVRSPEGGAPSMVIVNTDTSLRRASEAQLAKRERLEGVASLAEGMSHDLMDRMAPLLLAAQSVGEKGLDDQAKKLVQVISQKVRQLDELSRQVAAVSLRPDETAGALPQGKAQLVMIFDPDLTVRTMLQTVIEANGYRAIPADDADQGIAFLAQYGERIKLVLFRPDMTDGEKTPLGLALAALEPAVPLVATDDPAKSGAPEGGRPLAGILQRPFSTPLLLRMLAEVLG